MTSAPVQVAARVGWVADDTGPELLVAVSRLPDGPVQVLLGSGGLIWLAVAEAGQAVDAASVAALVAAGTAEQRDAVSDFLDELVALGLLATA